MKNARMKLRMSYRDMAEATGMKPSRLCDLDHNRAVPTDVEATKIKAVLGDGINFADEEAAKKNQNAILESTQSIRSIFNEVSRRGLEMGNGGHGEMPCPKCGSLLVFTVAAINGHVHAHCSTGKCISFMQ